MEAEWLHRPGEGRKVARALKNVWNARRVTTEANLHAHDGIVASSAL